MTALSGHEFCKHCSDQAEDQHAPNAEEEVGDHWRCDVDVVFREPAVCKQGTWEGYGAYPGV